MIAFSAPEHGPTVTPWATGATTGTVIVTWPGAAWLPPRATGYSPQEPTYFLPGWAPGPWANGGLRYLAPHHRKGQPLTPWWERASQPLRPTRHTLHQPPPRAWAAAITAHRGRISKGRPMGYTQRPSPM